MSSSSFATSTPRGFAKVSIMFLFIVRMLFVSLTSWFYYLCHTVDGEKVKHVTYLVKKYSAHYLTGEELTNEPHKASNFMIGYSTLEKRASGATEDLFIKSMYRRTTQPWFHWVCCLGYNREVCVYQLLNEYQIASVPRLIDFRQNSLSGNYFIVLEKINDTHVRADHQFQTYPDYMNVAKVMLTGIGKLHVFFQSKQLPAFLLPVSNAGPISGIKVMKSKFPPLIHTIYDALEEFLNQFPPTLIHGDFRPGNILVSNQFAPDAKNATNVANVDDQKKQLVHFIDWYHPMRGNGLYDYVYFVSLAGNIHCDELFATYCHAAGLDPNDPTILDLLLMIQFEFILICYFYRKSGIEDTFQNTTKDLSHWETVYLDELNAFYDKKSRWMKLLGVDIAAADALRPILAYNRKY